MIYAHVMRAALKEHVAHSAGTTLCAARRTMAWINSQMCLQKTYLRLCRINIATESVCDIGPIRHDFNTLFMSF